MDVVAGHGLVRVVALVPILGVQALQRSVATGHGASRVENAGNFCGFLERGPTGLRGLDVRLDKCCAGC